jgi:hypothetical protein
VESEIRVSLESGCRFCVGVSGRNADSVAVKIFFYIYSKIKYFTSNASSREIMLQ